MKNLLIVVLILLSQSYFSCSKKEDVVPQVPNVEFEFNFEQFDEDVFDFDGNYIDRAEIYAKYGDMIITGAQGQIEALDIKLVQKKPGKPEVVLAESGYGAGLGQSKWIDPQKFDSKIPFYITHTEYQSNFTRLYKSFDDFKSDQDLAVVARFVEGKTVRVVTWKNDGMPPVVNMLPVDLVDLEK